MRTFVAVALLSVACSQSSSNPGADVGHDAARTSSRKHLAKVEVLVYTNVVGAPPLVGAKVAFVDPDGDGEIVMTDTDGIARGQVVVGGSVTALVSTVPTSNPPLLSTVLYVQDGDRISLGFAPSPLAEPPLTGTPSCTDPTVIAKYTHIDTSQITGVFVNRATQVDSVSRGATTVTPTIELAVPGRAGERVIMNTYLHGPNAGDQQEIAEVIDGCASTYKLNIAHDLLPWVGVPSLDTATGVIHVPMDGEGGGDVLEVFAGFSRGDQQVGWTVYGPHAGNVYLPALPGELADLVPREGDQVTTLSAMLRDADIIHGYDQVRQDPRGAIGKAFGLDGRVRSSYRAVIF